MTDHTRYARNMAKENTAICSHFEKNEDPPQFAWCVDCGQQLLRQHLRKRTGKTARRRLASRSA